MDPGALQIAAFAALGAVAGLLIGCVGVGGVILVPLLVYVAGVPVQAAIAAAMCAFVLSGIVGTYVFARNASIRWDMTAWMWAGAAPAAFAGALLVDAIAPRAIELGIGVLTFASGAHALVSSRRAEAANSAQPLSASRLAAIGGVTGLTSAMTGTGGPLVLIPILVWLEMPTLASIGLAQAVQLPIAVAATAGNVMAGALDVALGLVLGAGIVFGTWGGARAAHAVPRVLLRRFVSVVLVAVGAGIIVRVLVFSSGG